MLHQSYPKKKNMQINIHLHATFVFIGINVEGKVGSGPLFLTDEVYYQHFVRIGHTHSQFTSNYAMKLHDIKTARILLPQISAKFKVYY